VESENYYLREHVLFDDGLLLVQHGLEDPLLAGRIGGINVVLWSGVGEWVSG